MGTPRTSLIASLLHCLPDPSRLVVSTRPVVVRAAPTLSRGRTLAFREDGERNLVAVKCAGRTRVRLEMDEQVHDLIRSDACAQRDAERAEAHDVPFLGPAFFGAPAASR